MALDEPAADTEDGDEGSGRRSGQAGLYGTPSECSPP